MSNSPDTLKIEFLAVIKDFSDYLSFRQQAGTGYLGMSDASETLVNSWGLIPKRSVPFFFQGPEPADIFLIDSEGSFFNGKSGELLAKILTAMALSSDAVFICNMADIKKVHQKIETVSPKVIITLGENAGQFLLNLTHPIGQFRGKFHEYHGIKVMPTFHPSLLLDHPSFKRQVWDDMKQVMACAGLKDGS